MFTQQNKYLLFIVKTIVIFSLIIPQPAFAFLPIFDPFKKKFQAIAPYIGSITDLLYLIFLVYAVSFILFLITTTLLQWVINQQTAWLTLEGNAMVEAGFAFTSGLANMFLILIFIACAFAIILKIEGFEVKKILPRLIIVALLLNFSLVFIGMIVDVSTILFNTILGDNRNLVVQTMNSLIGGGQGLLQNMITMFASWAVASKIPFIGPFAQAKKILGFGAFFLPNLLIWILQIIAMSLMAGILFVYILLFVGRVFIIQILAIFAPLVFLCLISPKTQKYFDEWLKALIGWVFLGIFVLLLLVIGLGAGQQLMPEDLAPHPIPGVVLSQIGPIFTYYLFLFIFLAIVIYFSKKAMPAGADSAIKGITEIGKIAAGTGLGVLGANMLKRSSVEKAVDLQEKAEKIKEGGGPSKFLSLKGLRERATLTASNVSNWAYRMEGTTAKKKEVKMAEEHAKEWANVPSEEVVAKNLSGHPEAQVARAIVLKDRGDIDRISLEDAKAVLQSGDSGLIKAIAPNYLEQMNPRDEEGNQITFKQQKENLEKRKIEAETSNDQKELEKINEELQKTNIAERITQKLSKEKTPEEGGGRTPKEEEERRRKEAVQKSFPTDPKKIENIEPTEQLIKTMIDFDIPPGQIAQFAQIHGSAFAENFKKTINNMVHDMEAKGMDATKAVETVANYLSTERPGLVKYAISSAGGSIITFPKEILNEFEKKRVKSQTQQKKKPVIYGPRGEILSGEE